MGTPAGNVQLNFPVGPSPLVFITPAPYTIGSMVPAGTTVTFHYYLTGNPDTLCFTLEILDTIPPKINTTLSSNTAECDVADYPGWITNHVNTLNATSTDNCSFTVSHNGPATFNPPCTDSVIVTFYVEDPSGNKDSISAYYKVQDTQDPVLTGVPADVSLDCTDPIPAVAMVTVTDNCDMSVVVTYDTTTSKTNTGACTDFDYTIIRTWSATDVCGNTVSDSQTINIEDTGDPDFDVPADLTLSCEADTSKAATGDISNIDDNCDPAPTISFSETITPGACPQEMTIIRTWTVTDACGNSTTKQQSITLEDNTPPVVFFPPDITVDCGSVTLNVTGLPSSTDNCDPTPDSSFVDINLAGLCPNSYTIERTWTVEDACGNAVSNLQIITVEDQMNPVINDEAQNETIVCDDGTSADAAFNAWVAANGNASASDNCTAPGNFTWEAYNTGTSDPASLAAPVCPSPALHVYRTRTVDFIVIDECGNRDTTTATFTVEDTTPPAITNCPADTVITTDAGVCEASRILTLPMVTEECGNSTVSFILSLNEPLVVPPGSDLVETPVNDVVFNFAVEGPPYTTSGNVTLTIDLNEVDAEAPTEFLNVYGEDGSLLGQAAHTPVQCGNSTTNFTLTAAQMDAWAFDGTVTITVKPNIPANQPGRFSVNPICPNNSVTATLAYDTKFPSSLVLEYSLNGSARIPVAPVAAFGEILVKDTNTVTYYFTDCAGNESSCSYKVIVEDKEAPSIFCPSDTVVYLDQDACTEDVLVPLFTGTDDNCGVSVPIIQFQPADLNDWLITYKYNPNLNDFVAEDKSFTFTGLTGNATPGTVQLVITIQGDVVSPNDYFEIYDHDNNLLGTTANGQGHVTSGDCNNPSTASFFIPAATFNSWASAGDINITAKSFMGFPIPPAGPGWGINPCDISLVNNDGDTDSSFIFATFIYESVTPTFSASGASSLDPMQLNPPLNPQVYSLDLGTTTFKYEIDDLEGNHGECTFDITVQDTIKPKALCGPTFVQINPSGLVQDTIFPNEIDLGSYDNCTIANMEVFPSIVTCLDAGIVNVELRVTDNSGNQSVCYTIVNVTTTPPQPAALSACGSSSLQLFANPPPSPGSGATPFQYIWYTPAGLPFAYVKDPIIQNASMSDVGFYNVQIQGVTGCVALASVQVTCDLLPLQKPVVSAVNDVICSDEQIQLTTAAVCGTTTQYKWYSGTAPNGTLLGTTSQPAFNMAAPGAGSFNFYVVVRRNNCDSEASNSTNVFVKLKPVATPAQNSIIICQGEQILLNSINNPLGSLCQWTGPCGFESFSCSPAPINNSTSCNSGFYQLVVSIEGCISNPALVAVNVMPVPPQPTLSNSTTVNTPACHGSQVTLTASAVQGAISYQWTTPTFTTISTPTNVLVIPSVDINKDAGQWTVIAIGNQCESIPSQATTVYIAPVPQGVAAAANPTGVCEGQNIQLSASTASQNVSYLWTYPNGQTNALQNPLLSNVTSSFNGTYTLKVTNQFNCSSTSTVNVNVFNRVNITGLSSNAPSCASGPVNVQIVATLFPLDTGSYTYSWTGPNGYSSTNATATLSNATINNSGPYTLIVTNAQGCSSLAKTVNVAIPPVLPTPGAPVLSTFNPFCEGDNVTLTTTAFPGPNAAYIWTTPTGSYTTSSPSLPISSLTVADAGTYTVQYSVNDCPSGQSGSTTVIVNPAPMIQPTSNTPVCEGQTLQLGLNCTAGASYEWTGPGGFSSSVCNPTIANANPSLHSGTYSVRKKEGGCWSAVVPVNVVVKPKPSVPTAINAGPYCSNTGNVMVSVTSNSATPGAMYTWYNSAGQPLGAATPSLNFSVPNPAQYGNGPVEFYVVASLDGCLSVASVPTVVSLNTIPSNIAEAGPDIAACQGEILTLSATPPTAGVGKWSLSVGNPAGVTIANPDQATTTVSGLTPGQDYVFQWSLSNGACVNYSTDTASVYIDIVEQAEAGDLVYACNTSTATLNATMPVSNSGMWTQTQAQASLGVVIVNPTQPSTQVTGLFPGSTVNNEFLFTWTIDGGCGMSSDVVKIIATNENAFAGADYEECGDGRTQLNAVGVLSGIGSWSSPDASIQFDTPTNPVTMASNLKAGINVLVWTTNNGACGHFSVDSVIVDYQFAPDPVDDFVSVAFGDTASINAVANDDLPSNFTFTVLDQPAHGSLVSSPNGLMKYKAGLNFVGNVVVTYEVCVENCECVTATVTFRVGEKAPCAIPTIITPNNDGINDAFIVPCLSDIALYPKNSVGIFNQWGDEVFHQAPYNNNWQGTFDGEDLPAGTYFFIVDFGTGEKPESGYLIIQR